MENSLHGWAEVIEGHNRMLGAAEALRAALTRLDVLIDQGVKGERFDKAVQDAKDAAISHENMTNFCNGELVSFLDKVCETKPEITWEEHDEHDMCFVSECRRFEVSMDPVYGYYRLHHYDDCGESQAESRNLKDLTLAAQDLIAAKSNLDTQKS